MSKTAYIFTKRHGRYMRGEVAGFEAADPVLVSAKQLGSAEPYDPDVHGPVGAQIRTGLDTDQPSPVPSDLADRAAELDRREAALAAREAALQAESPVQAGTVSGAEQSGAQTLDEAAGAPPKQGAKK